MGKSKGFIVILRKEKREPVKRAATIFSLTEGHPKPERVLDDLGVVNHRHYKTKPHKCSICRSTVISTLEIVGVSNDPLFWECEDCGALFCIKNYKWICEQIVENLYDCWTNPQTWEDIPDKEDWD